MSAGRVYVVMLTKDLFGQWVVMSAWGGRFNQLRGAMNRPVASVEEGLALMKRIAIDREKHGYRVVG